MRARVGIGVEAMTNLREGEVRVYRSGFVIHFLLALVFILLSTRFR